MQIVVYLNSRYIAVIYDVIMHTAEQLQWQNFGQIYTHERHPYLALTGELWDVFRELYKENDRDISSALYLEGIHFHC